MVNIPRSHTRRTKPPYHFLWSNSGIAHKRNCRTAREVGASAGLDIQRNWSNAVFNGRLSASINYVVIPCVVHTSTCPRFPMYVYFVQFIIHNETCSPVQRWAGALRQPRRGGGMFEYPPPPLNRLLDHVATYGKRHSKERQKSCRKYFGH